MRCYSHEALSDENQWCMQEESGKEWENWAVFCTPLNEEPESKRFNVEFKKHYFLNWYTEPLNTFYDVLLSVLITYFEYVIWFFIYG